MARSKPKLTIGLPVYNGAEFLATSIQSLLGQTYEDFELLICDNASTDETEAICRGFQQQDSRVVYDRAAENCGSVWNFNRAFTLSDSPYFKWAADDDFHAPTYLEKCLPVLDGDASIAWCHSLTTHVDVHGRPVDISNANRISYQSRDSDNPIQRLNSILLASSCLDSFGVMRSDIVRRTRLLLPYFGSEKVFLAELALYGRYREVPEELFFSRIHPNLAGALETAREQQEFIDPRMAGPPRFTRWHLLAGYASAIRRSPLSFGVKLAAFGSLTRYLFQISKWKRVITKAVFRKGIGGDVRVSADRE